MRCDYVHTTRFDKYKPNYSFGQMLMLTAGIPLLPLLVAGKGIDEILNSGSCNIQEMLFGTTGALPGQGRIPPWAWGIGIGLGSLWLLYRVFDDTFPGDPPNHNDPKEDPCSEDTMRRRVGARSVAEVIYESLLGDRINGRVVKAQVNQGIELRDIVQMASSMCKGKVFPVVPIYRGRTFDTLLDGHHRFVASRLSERELNIIYTDRAGPGMKIYPTDLISGNLPGEDWRIIQWIK